MAVTNGYHPVRLSSIADELDEIDPRVRSKLVERAKSAPRPPAPRTEVVVKTADVDADRGPDNPRSWAWNEEYRALAALGKRRCAHCRMVKLLAEFQKGPGWCNECRRTAAREQYRAQANGSAPRPAKVAKAKPSRTAAAASPSKGVLQMIAQLRGIVRERDELKSQAARLRTERDQAIAELEQLMSDLAAAVK